MNKSILFAAALSAAAFMGCASDGDDAVSSIISTGTEAAGANCENGGLKVESGLDLSGDGVLDADEITDTDYICSGDNGVDGAAGGNGDDAVSTLVTVTDEAAGANCANGGQRVDFGADTSGDGVLDFAEIEGTTFVCNGDDADTSLLLLSDEAAGANCAEGGIRIDSGIDTSLDGVLDAGEITDTEFVCNGLDVPNFQAFTSDTSFTVPAGVFAISALVVGGGGGAPNGHQGGGGSGNVAMASVAVTPGDVIAITVGAGGQGANLCVGCNTIVGNSAGGASSFGALAAAGGETVIAQNGAAGDGGSGGGGSCNGGSVGGDGGTNGSDGGTCNQPEGTGQGDFTPLLTPFTARILSAGTGGTGGGGSHAGGGGGGGILIDATGPAAEDGAAAFSALGGDGFGAGGGAGGLDLSINGDRAAGGDGADGLVYLEF